MKPQVTELRHLVAMATIPRSRPQPQSHMRLWDLSKVEFHSIVIGVRFPNLWTLKRIMFWGNCEIYEHWGSLLSTEVFSQWIEPIKMRWAKSVFTWIISVFNHRKKNSSGITTWKRRVSSNTRDILYQFRHLPWFLYAYKDSNRNFHLSKQFSALAKYTSFKYVMSSSGRTLSSGAVDVDFSDTYQNFDWFSKNILVGSIIFPFCI